MEEQSNRRKFLKLGMGSAAGILAVSGLSEAIAKNCGITPQQTSGPFYPGETQFGKDVDLTFIKGRSQRAKGQVVYVRGKVLDHLCRPIPNANVEIWQACHTGKYNHSRDPNPAPMDPNFRYWAETFTNAKGEYIFKTIIPGAYPADTNWYRPPHIHFRVTRLGYRELVTQMYFKGEALNDSDFIIQQIPAHERDSVIVDFVKSPVGFEPGTLTGHFDITLRPVRV